MTIGLDGTGFFSFYPNAKGYQAPPRIDVGSRALVSFLDGRLTPGVSFRITRDGEELWHGAIGGEGSMERVELLLGGSLAWRFVDRWWIAAAVVGRVATITDAPTFKSVGTFSFSVGSVFDLWDTEDERRARGETVEDDSPIRRTERDGVIEFEKD